MLSAIATSPYSAQPSGGKSSAILNVQLAKYHAQLADWENCPSCKTLAGKAKIADILDKISEIESRINAAERQRQEASRIGGSAANQVSGKEAGSLVPNALEVRADGVGTLLNVYA